MTKQEKITALNYTGYRLQTIKNKMYWIAERVKEFHSEFSKIREP